VSSDARDRFHKDLIARLQSQLAAAHSKLGYTVAPSESVSGSDVPLWVLDPSTLSPLVAAYDRRIEVIAWLLGAGRSLYTAH
jgi:hypothetical protein